MSLTLSGRPNSSGLRGGRIGLVPFPDALRDYSYDNEQDFRARLFRYLQGQREELARALTTTLITNTSEAPGATLDAALLALLGGARGLNEQTANYVLALTDAGKIVEMTVAGANTLTVPPNASVAFPLASIVRFTQSGAGQTTLTPGSGVTIQSSGGKLKTAAQWAHGLLYKRATNVWVASGDLTT